MSTSQEHFPEWENTYVLDPESAAEMARLIRQDQLFTSGMGGVLSEIDLGGVQRVLDLACGPGGWALDVASTYWDMEVVGVDISERMITYAQAQAQARQRPNVNFRVMNILEQLDFPDASFDLVNARFVSSFVRRDKWHLFFRDALRVLRPGGILRLTEPEVGMSNKLHFEEAVHIAKKAMNRAGLNFSPNGYHYGIVHMLPHLFQQASLPILGKQPYYIDYSFGTEVHRSFFLEITTALHLFEPLIVKTQTATSEEWRELAQKGLAEMYEEDFCAAWMLLTIWGEKPM